MRFSGFIVAVSGIVLLAGCANGQFPSWGRGYDTAEAGPILKPSGVQNVSSRPASKDPVVTDNLVWNNINGYGDAPAADTAAEAPQKKSGPVEYRDVTVYPVDGDRTPYDDMTFDFTRKAAHTPDTESSLSQTAARQPAEQVFFGLGKSAVVAADRQHLKQLAVDVKHASKTYTVRVIGNASRDARDTAKTRKANMALAQKRADAVAQELKKAGLKASSIRTFSRGDSAGARRVDIFVEAGE